MKYNIKDKISNNKKSVATAVIFIMIIAAIVIFINNNYFLYKSPVAKVVSVNEKYTKSETGSNNKVEKYYKQDIKLLVLNGKYKGEKINVQNTYAESLTRDIKYKKGMRVFVSIKDEDGQLSASISGVKRDLYLAVLCTLMILGLIIVSKWQGITAMASLAVNVAIFAAMMKQYTITQDIGQISLLMILLFSVTTMLLLCGISKKSIGALISILLSESAVFLIYQAVMHYTEAPPYEMMDYIIGMDDLSRIYTMGIITGCLGAVMDVAITINSTVSELIKVSENIKIKTLISSIREVGHDIMGTMINVMLFAYITGSFTIAIIKIANGYSLITMINFNLVFEITRFLVGSIGIVLAIPVSGITAIIVHKGVRKNANCT